HRDRHGDCRVDVPGRHRAVVAGHGRLERQRRAGRPGPGVHTVATSGSTRFSEQAMPKLPCLAGHRGPSRTGPDQGRQPPDTRPAHRPGQQRHPGRRQHAGLRQADQACRDERPGRFPGQPAPARSETGTTRGDCPTVTTASPAMMNPTFDAVIRSWPFEPWLYVSLLLAAGIYLRGWLVLHRRSARRWSQGQLIAFLAGLTVLFLALASPIEPFTSLLLQVHMLQHLLLMMLAPPLLWLGAPQFPLLLGLPRPIRTYWVAPLFRSRFLRRTFQSLTHPVPAWLLFTAATWFWHFPPIYELVLRSDGWHYLQHISFLGTAILFWYPVIRPYPSRPSWSPWLLIPYLILADVQNTLLSALLTFSDQPLYAYYAEGPRLGNLSPLDDQAVAGVLMWVPGSVAYLVPLCVIGIRLLFGGDETTNRRPASLPGQAPGQSALPVWPALPIVGQSRPFVEPTAFDVLKVPLAGRFLRWRHARLSFQLPLLLLAGLLPWIHWRGLIVLGTLVAGNVFCMACPFMVPRTLARRWLPRGRSWPSWLRNKWLAVCLLIAFLWAYEAFALWDSPWWTAWIVVAYFTAAFVIDGFFRGAAFCKYVCPIGQFNFVQ